jgi:uncharacterized protein YozE (UPF0346 family)
VSVVKFPTSERRTPFFRWLSKQRKREDTIGDFARDAVADFNFPRWAGDCDAIANYLRAQDACNGAIGVLCEAWAEWERLT